MQTKLWLNRLRESVLGLCFAPACPACGEESAENPSAAICPSCQEQMLGDYANPCPRCAMPNVGEQRCPECQQRQHRFVAAVAVGRYDGLLRRLVLRAKAGHDDALSLALGNAVADSWLAANSQATIDAIVATPMPGLRRIRRRANLAETLAEAVSRRLRVPMLGGVLAFLRYPRPQHNLKAAQRKRNLRQALTTTATYDITGSHLLVIDDVLTTGSTADEMSRALLAAGAASVSVAVIARGVGID